jgi:hypothetical protein
MEYVQQRFFPAIVLDEAAEMLKFLWKLGQRDVDQDWSEMEAW